MRRDQLAHILRAAARITEDNNILVIGSQSILASFDEDELPGPAWPSRALCLEPHDLVVSKLVAGREKDYVFAWELMNARLVDADVLLERSAQLETVTAVRHRVRDWILAMKGRLT